MNNFQKLVKDREDMLPPELEFQVMREASTLGHFGDMVSLFLLNTVSTVVHIVTGGEEAKCLVDKRKKLMQDMEERQWCQPNQEPADALPEQHGTRHWAVQQ
jgi:hypothetical protein